MVKLSKPGHSPQPVSYINVIDDENVLKALEILRGRAVKVSAQNLNLPPTNPSSNPRTSKRNPPPEPSEGTPSTLRYPSTPEGTSINQPSAAGSPSSRTRVQNAQTSPINGTHLMHTPRAGSRSSGTTPRSSKSTPILKTQPQQNEFIPKWKTNPRVDTEAMFPRWQRETYALESAAEERARLSAEARALAQFESVQKESTSKGAIASGETLIQKNSTAKPARALCVPRDGVTSKVSTTTGSLKLARTRSAAMAATPLWAEQTNRAPSARPSLSRQPTGGLWKRLAARLRRQTTSDDQGDDHTRASLDGTYADEDSRVALLLESICDFGCFNMVDEIFHPAFDDFTYVTGADDSITRGSFDEGYETGYISPEDRTFEAGTRTQDSDELTQIGLFEFGPMITILEKFSAILDGDKSNATQRQYMTNLLEMMEDRLQEFGGYRRRRSGKGSSDPQTVSGHIREVNGLILRIVEDFLDKQLMRATNGDDMSVGSTRASNDESTVADDTAKLKFPRSQKSTSKCHNSPHSPKSPNKCDSKSTKDDTCRLPLGSPPGHTKFASRDVVRKEVKPNLRTKPRSESADGRLNASVPIIKDVKRNVKPKRRSGSTDGRFNSRMADDKPAASPKRRGRSNDEKVKSQGTEDEKSFVSSRTGGSRGTLLMGNLTSVFSRTPKRRGKRSKSQGSVRSINEWDGTRFVEADSGIPPHHPKNTVVPPVKRMPFSVKGANHHSSTYGTSRSGKALCVAKTVHGDACAGPLVDTSIDSSDGGSVGPFDDVSV